jgi:hypothetical protein
MAKASIIPCRLLDSTRQTIDRYVDALQEKAAEIGDHGLSEDEFWESGIFRSAIEKIRGTQAATTEHKRGFVESVLDYLQQQSRITEWKFSGTGERHDYEVKMYNGRICVIETKGCLDGNNTNIFRRPSNADEFVIWSLCQNPGADPGHNAWSGIHTRLSAEIIHSRQLVDGVIIWDMVCGTKGRPCPKLQANPDRATHLSNRNVPPPCLYLFPRTIPDPRNNPAPSTHQLHELSFLQSLYDEFNGNQEDIVTVRIETRMAGADVERKTSYYRNNDKIAESNWTELRRSR